MQKMINFDDVAKENTKEHYPNWLQILDHPYRILTIAGSGYGKTSALFNLINQKPDIDKICLYAKDPYEAKHQFLITKRKDVGTKHFNDSKAFIEEYSIKALESLKCFVRMIFIKPFESTIQIRNVKY